MHIIQAIKMACKSLWSNKLRSFLTMLGIIIGVVTVALLTSVASGVSNAVVSSIRSQSTLAVMMNASEDMTISYVDMLLKSNQHEKTDEDYYDYSLIYSSSATIANTLTGASVDGNFVNEYLFYNKSHQDIDPTTLSDTDKQMYQMVMMANQRPTPTTASISAVSSNFLDIYEINIEGEFPDAANEVLVDREFLSYYLGFDENDKSKDAIGQTFSIGVKYYSLITLNFKEVISDDTKTKVLSYIANAENLGLGESLSSQISADGKSLQVAVKYFTTQTNQTVIEKLTGTYVAPNDVQALPYTAPEFASLLVTEDAVTVEDIYDISNQKVYTISGIYDDSGSFISTSANAPEANSQVSVFDLFTLNSCGSIYMLLDDDNIDSLTLGKVSSVGALPASYAYLRFKTESVMDERVNELTLTLMSSGKKIMEDFMLISMSSVASIISNIMDIMTTMLTVISIISLIVGGIGIMNIMLVAVTERTREIGIRKAIGAKRSAILVQFLVEALMLSIIGGLIGLGISAIGCLVIGNAMGFAISMPLWVIGMSLGFCTLIGLVFGMFPAIKASKMQPIDALRRD